MKGFNKLNKLFDSRVRLGIMSLLMLDEWVSYKEIKSNLGLTDGNLASHIAALEKNKLIDIKKTFIGKKPHTAYKATTAGRSAFESHLNALEEIIKNNK